MFVHVKKRLKKVVSMKKATLSIYWSALRAGKCYLVTRTEQIQVFTSKEG